MIPEGEERHEERPWYPGFLYTGGHFQEKRTRKGNLKRTLMFQWAEETHKTEGLGLQSIEEDGIMKRKHIIVSHETGHRTIFRTQTGL